MPQSKYLEANGVRLHYFDWGTEGLQPLVLLHGHPLNAHAWDGVAEAFTDSYHIIAPDLRGHGDSDWAPPYGGETFLPDLSALIQLLSPRPVVICGNSMGGTTAYTYAAQHPDDVERLVLVDTVAAPPMEQMPGSRPPGPPPLPAGPFESPEEAIAAVPPVMGPVFQRLIVDHNLKPDGAGKLTWKFDFKGHEGGFERAHRNEPLWDYWRAVRCPTLVLRGERSPACPLGMAEAAAKAHADATLVTVPDAGHFIALEQPSAFVAEVRRWLGV